MSSLPPPPLYGRESRHVRLEIELALEHLPILSRPHLEELAAMLVPVIQNPARHRACGILMMAHDQGVNLVELGLIIEPMQFDHSHVALAAEAAVLVEHVGEAAAHPGGKVAPGRT